MINFLINNLVTDSTISVTTGTANSQFPTTNIQEFFTTKVARVSTVGSEAIILIDLNRAEAFDTIALVPNNLTGFGYTSAQVRFSTTTNFTGSKTNIPLDSLQGWSSLFTSQSGIRYIELTFAAGSFAEISKIYIGSKTILASTVSFSIESFNRSINRNDTITTNPFGQRFSDIRNSQVYYSGQLSLLSQADIVTMETIYALHGQHTPLWFLFDENNELLPNGFDTLSGYFYLDNEFSHDVIAGGPYFNLSVDLVEAT